MIDGPLNLSGGFLSWGSLNNQIRAMVAPSEWVGELVDKELLLGCVLREARIVVSRYKQAFVWVRYTDRQGAARVGRLVTMRRNKPKYEPAIRSYLVEAQEFRSIEGAWWPALLATLSRRGGLADGFFVRVDYHRPSRYKNPRNPVVVARFEYGRALAMRDAALGLTGNVVPYLEDAAARYIAATEAAYQVALSNFVASGGTP